MILYSNITHIKFVTLSTADGQSISDDQIYNFALVLKNSNDENSEKILVINAYEATKQNGYVTNIDFGNNTFNFTCDSYYMISPSNYGFRDKDPANYGLFVSSDGYNFSLADMKTGFYFNDVASSTNIFNFNLPIHITAIKFLTKKLRNETTISNNNQYDFIVSFDDSSQTTIINVNAYDSFKDNISSVTPITLDTYGNPLDLTLVNYNVECSSFISRDYDPSIWSMYISLNSIDFLNVSDSVNQLSNIYQIFSDPLTTNSNYEYIIYPPPISPVVNVNDEHTGSNLTISWDGYTDPNVTYDIYNGTDAGSFLINLSNDQLYLNASNLTAGTIYTYGVVAKNANGSSTKVLASGTPTSVPGIPENVNGSASQIYVDGSVILYWNSPEYTGGLEILGFKIYGIGQDAIDINPVATEYTIYNLSIGNYTLTVTAYNELGESSESTSNWAFSVIETPPPTFPPTEPTNVTATDQNNGRSVILRWNAPSYDGGSEITSYNIYHDDQTTLIESVGPEIVNTDYIIDGLTKLQSYTFYVSATNLQGTSTIAGSNSVTITYPPPISVDTSLNQDSSVTVFWTLAENYIAEYSITGYKIYINNLTDETQGIQLLNDNSATSFTIFGLHAGSTYTFQISGVTEYGDSTMSFETDSVIITYACFIGSSKVTMADGTKKEIRDINKGDLILQDKVDGIIGKVVQVTINNVEINAQFIPKMLVGNANDIICSRRHKLWINNKITRAHDIVGSHKILIKEPLYNIQFCSEGTYYVENVKVESLSPNNKNYLSTL